MGSEDSMSLRDDLIRMLGDLPDDVTAEQLEYHIGVALLLHERLLNTDTSQNSSLAEARAEYETKTRSELGPQLTKMRIIEALQNELAEEASLVDAMDYLYYLHQIEEGLADIDAGRTVPHEQILREIEEWSR
jgi:predicted transcriptional regulator